MNSNDIENLLKLVDEVIPLPTGFTGKHHLTLEPSGGLNLGLWVKNNKDEVKSITLTFTDEEINKEVLEDIKQEITKIMEKEDNDSHSNTCC